MEYHGKTAWIKVLVRAAFLTYNQVNSAEDGLSVRGKNEIEIGACDEYEDAAGRFPKDFARGVQPENALYNALTEFGERVRET